MRRTTSALGATVVWAMATTATPAPLAPSTIDSLVFARLQELGTTPAAPCSDAVFLRRAHLDLTGTIPTAAEARAFLADPEPDRRALLVDRLLARPEHADYMAMRWSERLRVKSEFPINLWPNAVQAYHRWIRAALVERRPYDRFARDLLTSSGSNFRVPPVNFYRALPSREPEAIAQAVALTFMGTRTQAWTPQQRDGLAAFFAQVGYKGTSEWKEEIVFFDPQRPPAGRPMFPDGTPASIPPGRDPREVFADWLTRPDNPWFARAAANHAWFVLFGRGLVHEADDLRPDNPPVHPEVLALLEKELVRSGYDLAHLYRLIAASQVYQQSSTPRADPARSEAQFAHYALRPLEAEVLIDALCQITGTSDEYVSRIPEPFTVAPPGQRAIALSDGSLSSAFLDTFGRPPRDTGLASERTTRPTAEQRRHLLNSSHVRDKIEQGPGLRAALGPAAAPKRAIDELYLIVLSRFPTGDESRTVAAHLERAASRRQGMADVAWALINSMEFQYRH